MAMATSTNKRIYVASDFLRSNKLGENDERTKQQGLFYHSTAIWAKVKLKEDRFKKEAPS